MEEDGEDSASLVILPLCDELLNFDIENRLLKEVLFLLTPEGVLLHHVRARGHC